MHHPVPAVEEIIDWTQDSVVHTCLDLEDGFFHVGVEEKSRKILAFVTPWAQYWPTRAPFGYCDSPKVFLRYLQYIFSGLIQEGIMRLFMDDIFVKAKDHEQAIERLKMVLEVAQKHGLRFKWKKSQILQTTVLFLGHEIKNGTIKPSPEKIQDLIDYTIPKTQKQIQRFLGLAGIFRKFIKNYATITKPLSDLLKKNEKFQFKEEQYAAVETLKKALTSDPILQIYSKHRETELHTDASADGYGAILLQREPKPGKMLPVYYMSRKTKPEHRNYHSFE